MVDTAVSKETRRIWIAGIYYPPSSFSFFSSFFSPMLSFVSHVYTNTSCCSRSSSAHTERHYVLHFKISTIKCCLQGRMSSLKENIQTLIFIASSALFYVVNIEKSEGVPPDSIPWHKW